MNNPSLSSTAPSWRSLPFGTSYQGPAALDKPAMLDGVSQLQAITESQMNSNTFLRTSGSALLAGGLLATVAHIIHPSEPNSPEQMHMYVQHSPAAHIALFFAVLLVLLGLPGLYTRVMARANRVVAILSLPLLFVGLALGDLMHCPLEFGAMPAIHSVDPDKVSQIYAQFNATSYGTLSMVAAPLLIVGILLFCIGSWRAERLWIWPRWILAASLFMMIATPLGVPYGGVLFTVLLYAAFTGYGFLLVLKPNAERSA